MLWSLALTPLVTAYCSTWDFTLLLPLFFWLFLHFNNIWSQIGLLTGMLMSDIWQILPRLRKTDVPDHTLWWVPVVLLVVFLLSMQIEQWKAPFSLAAMPARKKAETKKLPGSLG
jgi:multisubunit Na+/H+ antiporter MnhE subunit